MGTPLQIFLKFLNAKISKVKGNTIKSEPINPVLKGELPRAKKYSKNLIITRGYSPFRGLGGILLILLLSIFFTSPLFSQKRQQLENQRKKLLKEIRVTSQLLEETQVSKEATLDRYITLQKQIEKREELIETLQQEIVFTNQSIDRSNSVVDLLADDVARLKEEYSEMIRSAYRQKLNKSSLLFIFSAGSFNDAFRRWQYLKQYDEYRNKQARLIIETQNTLNLKVETLEGKKEEKEKLLTSEKRQAEILSYELTTKNELLKKLKNDEARLTGDLDKKRKAHRKLNDAIESVIRDEMAKRRRAERKNTPPTKKSEDKTEDIAETPLKSGNFGGLKGKLPWPVKSGIITSYFGKQQHPTIKTIQITNNGIDIKTDKNAEVRSVYSGKVVGKQFIPGHNYMVIIQHGNYYTVYSNLEEVFIQKGDVVKSRQVIGKVSTDIKTNTSEVHFEVWKDKNRLNPTGWIKK